MNGVVSNASPLIVLAKADLLWILPRLFSSVLLPQAVRAEIEAGDSEDPMRKLLASCSWLVGVELVPPLSPLSVWQLGHGESEVIEYVRLHGDLLALLDDRVARRAAQTLGVKVHGTLSVVAMAVRGGHVPSFPAAVAQLKAAGLYVSDDLVVTVNKGLR
jgi:predicted nucleic acid-binding protein